MFIIPISIPIIHVFPSLKEQKKERKKERKTERTKERTNEINETASEAILVHMSAY